MAGLTKEQFITKENEEEIFSVIESFLNRAREKGCLKPDCIVNGYLVITDEEKGEIIQDMIKDFQSDKV